MGNVISRCRSTRTNAAGTRPYLPRRLLSKTESRVYQGRPEAERNYQMVWLITDEMLDWVVKHDWKGLVEMFDPLRSSKHFPHILLTAAKYGSIRITQYMLKHVREMNFPAAAVGAVAGNHANALKIMILIRKKCVTTQKPTLRDEYYRRGLTHSSPMEWIKNMLAIQKEEMELPPGRWDIDTYNDMLITASLVGNLKVIKLAIKWGANRIDEAMFCAVVLSRFKAVRLLDRVISEKDFRSVYARCVVDGLPLSTLKRIRGKHHIQSCTLFVCDLHINKKTVKYWCKCKGIEM